MNKVLHGDTRTDGSRFGGRSIALSSLEFQEGTLVSILLIEFDDIP
jgi:hypothetical protein